MLHIVATPIGNLGDLTPRALEALRTADLIACEDTRRTWALLTAHNLPRPTMISYRQGNEERAGEQLVVAVQAGRNVVLCSDGGYPGISDPGYRLIRRAAQEGLPFDVLPGASAVDVALLLSGLILLTRPSLPALAPHIPIWFTTLVISRDVVVKYFALGPFSYSGLPQFVAAADKARKMTILAVFWFTISGIPLYLIWFRAKT